MDQAERHLCARQNTLVEQDRLRQAQEKLDGLIKEAVPQGEVFDALVDLSRQQTKTLNAVVRVATMRPPTPS